jgi:hypothetical protein
VAPKRSRISSKSSRTLKLLRTNPIDLGFSIKCGGNLMSAPNTRLGAVKRGGATSRIDLGHPQLWMNIVSKYSSLEYVLVILSID